MRKKIENMKFSGVVLYHNLPSSFIVGEIFQIRGKITIPTFSNSTHVTFCFINKYSILLKYVFSVTVTAEKLEFFINVDTRFIPAGEYYIGLYPGSKLWYNPKATYTLKSVLTETNEVSPPSTPLGCSLEFLNNKLLVKWNEDNLAKIKRINFVQNGQSVEYLLSNFVSSF
jgi:hypothetical protein